MGKAGSLLSVIPSLSDKFQELDKRFGEGNYTTRKVSKLNAKGEPAVTITKELKQLNLKPDDVIVVAVTELDGKKGIWIEPLEL